MYHPIDLTFGRCIAEDMAIQLVSPLDATKQIPAFKNI